MGRIVVDADACPAREIIYRVARDAGVKVILLFSPAHDISAPPGVETRRVDAVPQAVDIAIANLAAPGDIVITQDWGLAAVCMGRGAAAISPTGHVYDPAHCEFLLELRHGLSQYRRGGGRSKGPRPRLGADDARLEKNLRRLIDTVGPCSPETGINAP